MRGLVEKGISRVINSVAVALDRRREVSSLASWLVRGVTRITGWQFAGEPPGVPQYVLIAAPHTSSRDFLAMLALDFAFQVGAVWMGKESLFRGPIGPVLRRLGGIPIDRGSRHNVVEQAVQAFRRGEKMVLVIAPEGTRSRTKRWKTGFYYIALGADVPIVLGFIDYGLKTVGFGPTLIPSGDIEADMGIIRDFYRDKEGKHPDRFVDVADVTG
jgi:1-acyl-sn-glycerol-3-phosphate acyltransferase